jgi:hypothetical protein
MSSNQMLVNIKTLTGRKLQLEVTEDMSVYDLKLLVSENQGIEIPQIRMIYGGSQLNDTELLSNTKLKAGDTIHLVLSLRGG